MHQLLTAYLYKHKNCPLPTLGSLQLQQGTATYLPGENKMLAPVPCVVLTNKELPTHSLVDYIAVHKKIPALEASAMLGIFCEQLKDNAAQGESLLPGAGAFFVDEEGKLQFRSEKLPASFLPEVVAERVIHKDDAHEVLVGDTYTNSTVMTEKLQTVTLAKSRWWIPAVVLLTVGAIALFIFYSQHQAGSPGNGTKVNLQTESKTYSQP